MTKEEICWLHCNDCGRDTRHLKLFIHRNKEFKDEFEERDHEGEPLIMHGDEGYHDWELFECQGCEAVFLRSKQYFSDLWCGPDWEEPFIYTYFPKRNEEARTKPSWYQTFIRIPDLQGHFILFAYKQIYELLESKKYLAAMITARALLETIAITYAECIEDKRSFKKNLEPLRKDDVITDSEMEHFLRDIYDAGSASMHRQFLPSEKAVVNVLEEIEQVIYRIYIRPKANKETEAEKPQRK